MTTATSPSSAPALERWSAVFDALEDDLVAAEASLAHGEVPNLARFVPPVGLPPLPPELAVRARTIADRQVAVQRSVTEQLAVVGRQLTARPMGGAESAGAGPRRAARFERRA